MFEILLQADRALASGDLDQAERSYWQLIELDASNAIAMAGLARVSMERGDRVLARTLAARSLEVDPESVAGRKILDALEAGGKLPEPEQPDLTLLAAQRLEALGRKRASGSAARAGGADAAVEAAARGPETGMLRAPAGTGPTPGQAGAAGTTQLEGPLRESLVEAEAPDTGEPAAHPSVPPRSRVHHALGDRAFRHFDPEELRLALRPADPFAAAESAAAVEAVDATDDLPIAEPVPYAARRAAMKPRQVEPKPGLEPEAKAPAHEPKAPERATPAQEDGAAEAEPAAQPQPDAQPEPAPIPWEVEAEPERAAQPKPAVEVESVEVQSVEVQSVEVQSVEVQSVEVEVDESEAAFEAAERASAELAAAETASEQITYAALEAGDQIAPDGTHVPPSAGERAPASPEEASEENAEEAALREAMAMVLGGGAAAAPGTAAGERATAGVEPAGQEETAAAADEESATPAPSRPTDAQPPAELPVPPDRSVPRDRQVAPPPAPKPPAPQKKGFLRRLRGH